MSPARVGVVVLTLVLAALLAVGVWGQQPQAPRTDDDYIAIARSVPEVFKAGTPGQVTVDRSGRLAVDFWFAKERIRVFIDPRTDRVQEVQHFPR